jgi:hypothetical protein
MPSITLRAPVSELCGIKLQRRRLVIAFRVVITTALAMLQGPRGAALARRRRELLGHTKPMSGRRRGGRFASR